MDFKSLIQKIDSLEKPTELPKAPKSADPIRLDEDTELRVLAGITALTESVISEKAVKKTEDKVDEAKFEKSGVRATGKKKGDVEKSTRKQYFVKLEKEGKMKGVTMVADEGESEGELRDRAKRENMGWTVASVRVKADEAVEEAAKPDFLDLDKDGNKKEPMKSAAANKGGDKKDDKKGMSAKQEKYFGKKNESVEEGSTGDYSAKKARAGKDIGKPGKGFAKIAKKAGEKYGSKERGEKVAGAVLKKLRAKESVESTKAIVAESVEPKITFKDMLKIVQESGGAKQLDPIDVPLWKWAQRVAAAKFEESLKQQLYSGLVYERMGGVFEMYDVLSEDQK